MTETAVNTKPSKDEIAATPAAMARIATILAKDDGGATALRISVEGGGCSGFSYKFALVNEDPADDDFIIASDTAKILIDPISKMYMGGSVVNFVDDLMGQSFQIDNPNAVASCGCGTSFSV